MDDEFDHEWDIKSSNGMNVTENKLYRAMKNIGLSPEPQYQISEMTVDFAFPEYMIAIEINGPYHKSEEQKIRDKKRWFVLNQLGWKRKTFNAEIVYKNPDLVAKKIKNLLPFDYLTETTTKSSSEEKHSPILEAEHNQKKKEQRNDLVKIIVVLLFVIFCVVVVNYKPNSRSESNTQVIIKDITASVLTAEENEVVECPRADFNKRFGECIDACTIACKNKGSEISSGSGIQEGKYCACRCKDMHNTDFRLPGRWLNSTITSLCYA